MTVKMECPSCHYAFPLPEDNITLPTHGAVAVCLNCADVSVWDNNNTVWLPPVGSYRRELLTMPAVIETMVAVREHHEQQSQDRETLRSLISHGFILGMSITDIVEEILEDGFHRHPQDGEDL